MTALKMVKRSRQALLAALAEAGAVITGDLGHIRCPFHQDGTGSLSVYGHNGDHRWRCHSCGSGGTIVDVLSLAEGLDVSEAMRHVIRRYGAVAAKEAVANPGPASNRPEKRVFSSVEDIAGLVVRAVGGTWTRQDNYLAVDGRILMANLRFDLPDSKKTFRPVHPADTGWVLGDPPGLLPLFNLHLLAQRPAEDVYVVEGEKAAMALVNNGILATTSPHGARAAHRADWTLVGGRKVIVWPDQDEPGYEYAATVTEILRRLQPPAQVSFLDPFRLDVKLPPGGDAADYLELTKKGVHA